MCWDYLVSEWRVFDGVALKNDIIICRMDWLNNGMY